MKFILIILISNLFSQFTLYKGNDYLRFAGNVSIYYNHRFYLENEDNFKKNRFGLKDARFQLKGELKQKLKYQIELDFAKFKGDTYIDEIEEIVEDELFKISEKMEFESFLSMLHNFRDPDLRSHKNQKLATLLFLQQEIIVRGVFLSEKSKSLFQRSRLSIRPWSISTYS